MKDYYYFYYLAQFSDEFKEKNLKRINENYADRFNRYDSRSVY